MEPALGVGFVALLSRLKISGLHGTTLKSPVEVWKTANTGLEYNKQYKPGTFKCAIMKARTF